MTESLSEQYNAEFEQGSTNMDYERWLSSKQLGFGSQSLRELIPQKCFSADHNIENSMWLTDRILFLIIERVEGIENPHTKTLHDFMDRADPGICATVEVGKRLGFHEAIQAIIQELEKGMIRGNVFGLGGE